MIAIGAIAWLLERYCANVIRYVLHRDSWDTPYQTMVEINHDVQADATETVLGQRNSGGMRNKQTQIYRGCENIVGRVRRSIKIFSSQNK